MYGSELLIIILLVFDYCIYAVVWFEKPIKKLIESSVLIAISALPLYGVDI